MTCPSGCFTAQIAFWDDVFERLVRTSEFNADVETNYAVANYRNSAATVEFFKARYAILKQVLSDLGMAKE